MPIEPISSPSPTGTVPVSAIENEIPTYRAISPMAVVALICGIIALLSFAHPAFLLSAGAAILLGILADRKIRLVLDEAARRWLGDAGYDPVYGARPLKRVIQRELQNPLAGMILAGRIRDGETVRVSVLDGKLSLNGKLAAAAE